MCWGNNQFGQLGIGNTTQQTSPVRVPGARNGRVRAWLMNETLMKQDLSFFEWVSRAYFMCADTLTHASASESLREKWGTNLCVWEWG
jgi:hypothetical protein